MIENHPQGQHGFRRGDIYLANMNPSLGSEQAGIRPVLVIQNDSGNAHAPTTIVAAITSRIKQCHLPTHVKLPAGTLTQEAVVLLEQIRTVDKRRLYQQVARLDNQTMKSVDRALVVSLGLETAIGGVPADLPAPLGCSRGP